MKPSEARVSNSEANLFDGRTSVSTHQEVCWQCGLAQQGEETHCVDCLELLPARDQGHPQRDAVSPESGARNWLHRPLTWVLVCVATALLGLVGWSVSVATTPEPQEVAADQAADEALQLFANMQAAADIESVQQLSEGRDELVKSIDRSLAAIDSADGTRPRLDAYRLLFSGAVGLSNLTSTELSEWNLAKNRISQGLSGVVRDDPLAGVLNSNGTRALESIQDLVDDASRETRLKEGSPKASDRSEKLRNRGSGRA